MYLTADTFLQQFFSTRAHFRIGNLINVTVQQSQKNDTQEELPQFRSYNSRKSWFSKQQMVFYHRGKWTLRHCKGKCMPFP
jgi:hypothetical protein